MKRDILWLIFTVIGVALAVYWTPTSVRLPRPPVLATAAPPPLQASPTPDSFSFYCTGSRHSKAYSGFSNPSNFPVYNGDVGLIANP